jgi:hypothetical protein
MDETGASSLGISAGIETEMGESENIDDISFKLPEISEIPATEVEMMDGIEVQETGLRIAWI